MGSVDFADAGEAGLTAVMPRSLVDAGWLQRWGRRATPGNHIGRGFVAAVAAICNGTLAVPNYASTPITLVTFNGSNHKLRKVHVADEASALVNLQQWFAVCVRACQRHAAGKRDCIRTRAGKRLGQAKSAVAQFDPAQVAITLRLGSEVAVGHLRQASRKAACGNAGIHAGQFPNS